MMKNRTYYIMEVEGEGCYCLCYDDVNGNRVVIDWEVDHHNVWQTGAMDETSKQGRDAFNRHREKHADGYEYYSEDELLNIKKYIESNPNTKKTSQHHDNSFVGQGFFKRVGASGRWK